MSLQAYNVAIIVGPQGININQRVEVNARLAFIAKTIADDGIIYLWTVGKDLAHPGKDVHADVTCLAYKSKVKLQIMEKLYRPTAEWLLHELARTCDEVWCLPGPGQDGRLCPVLPAKLLRLASGMNSDIARRFKPIQSWYPLPEADTRVKSTKKEKRK